jgi:hypothetical protein
MIIFRVQIDPLEFDEKLWKSKSHLNIGMRKCAVEFVNGKNWNPNLENKLDIEQLVRMRKCMVAFIDEVFAISGREFIKGEMYVNGEIFNDYEKNKTISNR